MSEKRRDNKNRILRTVRASEKTGDTHINMWTHLEKRNLFTHGNLYRQTERQQENVKIFPYGKKSKKYVKTSTTA